MSYSISIAPRGQSNWYMRIRPHGQTKKINIPLGPINKKLAEKIRSNVDELLRAHMDPSIKPQPSTLQWLKEQSAEFQNRLATAGLIPGRKPGERLRVYLDDYIANQPTKDSTIDQLRVVANRLAEFLGEDRDVNTITLADAIEFRNWLLRSTESGGCGMADNTVRRYTGRARQMFAAVEMNPFADRKLPVAVGHDETKDFFVTVDLINEVMAHAGGPEWEAAIALARYGGFRACEIPALRWEQVDWNHGAITLDSPKTGRRILPLFTELRPKLEEWFVAAPDRTGRVIVSYTDDKAGLDAMRTQLRKIIIRSGNTPWPKVWQNLRATRETELLELFPLKSVTKWLGNSKAVAMKHYVMAREQDFLRAAGQCVPCVPNVTGENGHDRIEPDSMGGEVVRIEETAAKTPEKPAVSLPSITRLGLEPRMREPKSLVLPITPPGSIDCVRRSLANDRPLR